MRRFTLMFLLVASLLLVGCSSSNDDGTSGADDASATTSDPAETPAEATASDPGYQTDADWWLVFGTNVEFGNDAATIRDAATVLSGGEPSTTDGMTEDSVKLELADGTEVGAWVQSSEYERQADFNLGVWGMVGDPLSTAVVAAPDEGQAAEAGGVAREMLRGLGATEEVMNAVIGQRVVTSDTWDLIGTETTLIRYYYGVDREDWAYVVYGLDGSLKASRARIQR